MPGLETPVTQVLHVLLPANPHSKELLGARAALYASTHMSERSKAPRTGLDEHSCAHTCQEECSYAPKPLRTVCMTVCAHAEVDAGPILRCFTDMNAG